MQDTAKPQVARRSQRIGNTIQYQQARRVAFTVYVTPQLLYIRHHEEVANDVGVMEKSQQTGFHIFTAGTPTCSVGSCRNSFTATVCPCSCTSRQNHERLDPLAEATGGFIAGTEPEGFLTR